MLTTKTFLKVKIILIFLILLNYLIPNQIFASKKRSIISGVEVKVYKKERKHIETAALLCSLSLNGKPVEKIRKALEINFQNPILRSDKFLLVDVMGSMCPELDHRKIFEN